MHFLPYIYDPPFSWIRNLASDIFIDFLVIHCRLDGYYGIIDNIQLSYA